MVPFSPFHPDMYPPLLATSLQNSDVRTCPARTAVTVWMRVLARACVRVLCAVCHVVAGVRVGLDVWVYLGVQ